MNYAPESEGTEFGPLHVSHCNKDGLYVSLALQLCLVLYVIVGHSKALIGMINDIKIIQFLKKYIFFKLWFCSNQVQFKSHREENRYIKQ